MNLKDLMVESLPSFDFMVPHPIQMLSPKGRRNASTEPMSRRRSAGGPPSIDLRLSPAPPEPLSPDTTRSPTSVTDTLAPLDPKWASFGRASPNSSHVSFEVDEEAENDGSPTLFEKPRGHRPLLLLTRSRGIQTDGHWSGALSPSPFPSHISSISPHDPRSETSSFSEAQSSHMSLIMERITNLLNRIAQADALTLTNRLKRQHLKGADVGHLSRSTVSNILAEANGLRSQFRSLLEDEKIVTTCSRKDLRALFKFIKDIFTEVGQLRVTLNEIILDPSSAPRFSELALNPGRADAERKEREAAAQSGAAGWMAPISKLFSPTGRTEAPVSGSAMARSKSAKGTSRPAHFVPKLRPALAASATTVNVEFSGAGVGRAVTSTFSAGPIPVADSSMSVPSSSQSVSSGVMGIFAGAPQPPPKPIDPADPWVILAPGNAQTIRKAPPFMRNATGDMSTATIGRSAMRRNSNRLSRNVDAVIDVDTPQTVDEEADFLPPLLERTLRRRGLSDSSIHSTFTNQGDETSMPPSPDRPRHPGGVSGGSVISTSRMSAWPDKGSVFQALSRTMFNFRQTAPGIAPSSSLSREIEAGSDSSRSSLRSSSVPRRETVPADDLTLTQTQMQAGPAGTTDEALSPVNSSTSGLETPLRKGVQPKASRVTSPSRGGVLPNLTSWAASNMLIDPVSGADPFIASSLRDESYMQRVARSSSRAGPKGTESHIRDFY